MLHDKNLPPKENSGIDPLHFLTGGGEMGAFIRSFDWSKTVIGGPDTWPQSLRIAVRIMLDCPFGMYIAWGKEYIQIYNDGYRPILGATKHPQALGISTRQTFAEVWPTIGPMFDEVMQGHPVGFPDFVLHLDRNGYIEECVFDFSYSPIRLENGEVGGVLVTVIETTKKVRAVNALKESESRFQNLVREANVGIIVLSGEEMRVDVVNEAYGQLIATKPDELLGKPLFDVIPEAEDIFRPLLNKVRQTGEPLYLYDQPYGVTVNGKKIDGYLNVVYQAYRETDGTITGVIALCQNVTEIIKNRKEIKEGELRFRRVMQQSPVATTLLKGPEFIVEIANEKALELWGKTAEEIINFPALKVMPELQTQGFEKILTNVFLTGQPYIANEFPVTLNRYGKSETLYINFIYEPLRNNSGSIEGIVGIGIDVTEQVTARKLREASELRFSNILSQSLMAIAIFKGPEMVVEFANEPMIAVLGKGNTILNKPLTEVVPELRDQIFPKLLSSVYNTGVPFEAFETKAVLVRNGIPVDAYFNFVYQPYRDVDNTVTGITVIATEVTEQVLTKKQMEESEKRSNEERMVLYNSFMNAPAGISILKGDTHMYEFVNAEYEKSVSRKITLGKSVQEHFPEIEQQGLLEILNNVFTTGEPFIANEFPVELINKITGKPELHYYNSAIQPMKDEKGNIERILTHGVEVTEQVEARRQIEEANNQLRTAAALTENIADAVVGTDMDYKTISWNKGAENLYGYTSEEVIGKYAMALLCTQFLSVEDQQAWSNNLLDTGKWQGEVLQSKKDGAVVSVLVSISYVYNENGKPIAVVAVNRDITERKKSEEKIAASESQFRTFADSIQNLAWIANSEGWRYWYNQQWYNYSGTTQVEMEGWGWQKIHHPDHIQKVIELVKDAVKKDEAFELTIPLRRHDGEYHWFLTRAYPVKDANGNIDRWIGTNTDINEQKINEHKKDEFISIASHEMKTPLTTAKGYLELLSLSLKEKDQTALYATKANQAVGRLHNLVTELLDASKIQNGQLTYSITTFDFNEMVDETIENFQHSAKNHVLEKSGSCEHMITGDRGRLQQVLINLFSNAVKYSPNADKVFVEIKELGDKVQLSVQDFGVGISAKHLDKIFERYYRVQENAIHFQGLGIGLYISHNIIERHNGTMQVISETAKGSTFYFTLPI